MAIFYKTTATTLPGEGNEGRKIWFPKLTNTTQMNLNQIAGILQQRSTASKSDVYLIIKGLVDLIPELLSEGYTLKLDELGTFRLFARVNTADSPDKVSARNIKELRVVFRADNTLRNEFKKIEVKPLKA